MHLPEMARQNKSPPNKPYPRRPEYVTKDASDLTQAEAAKRWKWVLREEEREERKKQLFLYNVKRIARRMVKKTEEEQKRFLAIVKQAADRSLALPVRKNSKTKRRQRPKPSM
jgi:hypothetical protein